MSKQFSAREIELIKLAYANGITDPKELAHFMGQCGHESYGINKTQEGFVYTDYEKLTKEVSSTLTNANKEEIKVAMGLAKNGKPETLANYMYNGRIGNARDSDDGWNYSGKGYIQLTGRANYEAFNTFMQNKGFTEDFVKNPELLKDPKYAGYSAIYFWEKDVKYYDGMSVAAIRTKINGGETDADKLASRVSWTNKYEAKLTPDRVKNIVDGKEDPRIDIVKNGSVGLDAEDVQSQLVQLKFLTGFADGNFGPGSVKALKAFQEKHGLETNGTADANTSALLNELAPLHDRVKQLENEITSKLDHINELNDQYKDYDRDSAGVGKVAIANQIHEDQVAIAQLEIDKNHLIDERLSEKQAALSAVNTELDSLKNDNPVTAIDESTLNQGIPTRIPELEAQQTALNNEIQALEARKDSMIEQQLTENTAKIAENNQSLEDYSAKNIDPLQNIKDTLADTANTSDESNNTSNTSAYQSVDYALTEHNVPLFPENEAAFFHNEQPLVRPKAIIEDAETKILQEQLIELKLLTGEADGKFGGGTESAVKEFQRIHLNDENPDGKVDSEVRLKLEELAQSRLTTEDISKQVDEEMAKRLADQTAMTKENATLQTDNEQLQSEQQILLTNQITLLEQQKIKLTEDVAKYDQQIKTIEGLEKTIDAPREEGVTPYASIKEDLSKNDLSLPHTKAEKALAAKETLSTDNIEDIKALQTLLHERQPDLLSEQDIIGTFGPTTRKTLAHELGLQDDPSGKTLEGISTLDKDSVTKLVENRLDHLDEPSLKAELTVLKDELTDKRDELTAQSKNLDEKLEVLNDKSPTEPAIELGSNPERERPEWKIMNASCGDRDLDRLLEAAGNDDDTLTFGLTKLIYERPDIQQIELSLQQEIQQDQIRQQQIALQEQQELQRQQQELAIKKGPSISL